MIQISRFRASFIWVETIPAILTGALPTDAPLRFLGQAGGYAECFDKLVAGTKRPDGMQLPWNSPGNNYWIRYFEGKSLSEATGAQAWKKFVPFRTRLGCKTITEDPAVNVNFEAYYAPQGIAIVATIECTGKDQSTMDVAKLALAVRHDYKFDIAESKGPPGGLGFDAAAAAARGVARRRGFGDVESSPGFNQPFSVATFIAGTADDTAALVQDGSDEHRALEAVTSWNRYIDRVDLKNTPIANAKLAMHTFLDSDMMYAHKSARAIWLPRAFSDNSKKQTMSCYHRNIMLASLQTLSLGEFVAWAAAAKANQNLIPAAIVPRVKRAADVLQMIADGKAWTYRTVSTAEQIKKADWPAAIATVKQFADA